MIELSDQERSLAISPAFWIQQTTVTIRRTDGRTERQTDIGRQ